MTTTICHKSGTDVLFPKKDGTISGNTTRTYLFCNRTSQVPAESVGNSTRLPIGPKGNQADPCLYLTQSHHFVVKD